MSSIKHEKHLSKNSLAIMFPLVAEEWHPTMNGSLLPCDVAAKSHKRIWWRCVVGHEWNAVCKNRTLNRSNCPYCAGQLATKDNCIAKIRPNWVRELHTMKNGSLNADNLCPKSSKIVWWICDKGHEWKEKPDARFSRDSGCPYCNNQRCHDDYCLAKQFPCLAYEWHPVKNDNITPYMVSPSSHKKVWWQCVNGHEWEMAPHNRHKGNEVFSCYDCQEVSKGERKVSDFLSLNGLSYSRQFRLDGCKNKVRLPFDFAVFLNNIIYLIEYQGIQHYKPVGFGASDCVLAFNSLKINDNIKREYCRVNGIPFIEIPYWDFDKIEIILRRFLYD